MAPPLLGDRAEAYREAYDTHGLSDMPRFLTWRSVQSLWRAKPSIYRWVAAPTHP